MNAPSIPVEFEQSLKMVKQAVESRVESRKPEQAYAVRAHLWVKWLSQNVLGGASHV